MEKAHFKIVFVVFERRVGELVQPGRANEDCLEVCFVGLVVGGNYVWCLVVVVIFVGFEGAKR